MKQDNPVENMVDNIDKTEEQSLKDKDIEIKKNIKINYNKIEKFFIAKHELLNDLKFISIDQIVSDAPSFYGIIRLLEQINSFVSKDSTWLRNFIENKSYDFNWDKYKLWKSGKTFYRKKYDDTQCPSVWVQGLQDRFIEILKMFQILFYVEFYIKRDDFQKFLHKFPTVDYKYKANYIKPITPSEKLDVFLKTITYLFDLNIKNKFYSSYIIDTKVCMQAYRYIDEMNIFDILKRIDFFLRYRLEYLKKMPTEEKISLPLENDIIEVCEDFTLEYKELFFSYTEYKKKLIVKYSKIKNRLY